jgi:hypothetical protein
MVLDLTVCTTMDTGSGPVENSTKQKVTNKPTKKFNACSTVIKISVSTNLLTPITYIFQIKMLATPKFAATILANPKPNSSGI